MLGTGKTLLAKALASHLHKHLHGSTAERVTFMNVSAADLISKWLGETEKLVRAMWSVARQHAPCVS